MMPRITTINITTIDLFDEIKYNKNEVLKMDKTDLNQKLIRACYEYPPDFEKMQKLVDMGANVNAFLSEKHETMLGEILLYYLSEITGEGLIKYDGISAVELCDRMCKGETVKGRNGQFILPIVEFFFNNGFDLTLKYNAGHREASYANNIFDNIKYSFSGATSMETLDYILSYVTEPELLCNSDGSPIKDEFAFDAYFEQSNFGLTYYVDYLLNASKIVESFMKEKDWQEFLDRIKGKYY